MCSRFTSQTGDEALFNEADTDHSSNDELGSRLANLGTGFTLLILNDSLVAITLLELVCQQLHKLEALGDLVMA